MTTSSQVRIAIVVGEVSGDILGAGLMRSLQQRYPDAMFEGIGGSQMRELGFKSLFDMEELAVMGLFEVLSRLFRLLHIRKSLYQYFSANPPDVFIGIDAPDFNLNLEHKLKLNGIKTVHYVSPSVWAWRKKRVFTVAAATNLVLSLFPFEKRFYDQHQVPCEFVGHTLADALPLVPDQQAARQKLGLSTDDTILAVLPGSRGNEVKLLLEPFLRAAEIIHRKVSQLQIVIPVINQARRAQIEAWLAANPVTLNITLVDRQSREVMTASNAILLASGTATLEAMLCKRPMLVAYRFSRMTAMVLRRMIKMDYFSLPNLLAGKKLVPELLQEQVQPDIIADQLLPLLTQDTTELVDAFTQLHQSLKCNADEQAANAVSRLIEA
ncbi:lipid-A-disaccharide synthase [Neptunicella sp. SCSIO 80796]|uniref:lipid-A-disaccharide synthase n=1 Tax=Neptunicella plasticusilytica TaxID=3117012 RepID=UPI003A4E5EDA